MLLADRNLARRIEEGEAAAAVECARALTRLRPQGGAATLAVGGGYAAFVGKHSPLSHALGLGLSRPVRESDLEGLELFYRSRGAAAAVEVCPLADPSLHELLSARGYRVAEFCNVLVRRIDPGESFAPAPAPLEVRTADASEAGVWSDALARGFFEGFEPGPPELEIGLILFHMDSAVSSLAFVGGECAGGAGMRTRDGLAFFYADSTLSRFRGRGVHKALIQFRLRAAAAQGCELATAAAHPGSVSQRNYERLGFRPVYTRATLQKE